MKDNNEWYTPAVIIQSLGEFDLDPATSLEAYRLNRSAKNYYTIQEDGLKQSWYGRIWLNPPYSSPLAQQFLKKWQNITTGLRWFFLRLRQNGFTILYFRMRKRLSFSMTVCVFTSRTELKARNQEMGRC